MDTANFGAIQRLSSLQIKSYCHGPVWATELTLYRGVKCTVSFIWSVLKERFTIYYLNTLIKQSTKIVYWLLTILLLLQLPYQIQPIPLVALYPVEHSTISTWRHRYILYTVDIVSNYAFALVSPSSHVYVYLTMTAIQCLVLPNGLMPVKQQLQLYWGYQPTSKW